MIDMSKFKQIASRNMLTGARVYVAPDKATFTITLGNKCLEEAGLLLAGNVSVYLNHHDMQVLITGDQCGAFKLVKYNNSAHRITMQCRPEFGDIVSDIMQTTVEEGMILIQLIMKFIPMQPQVVKPLVKIKKRKAA